MKITKLTRRDIANLAGLALAGYLTFMVVKVVKQNYDLQGQINQLQTQISQLNDQKAQLAYKVQYYQTDTYKQQAARANLGLQQPGEGVIILPPSKTPTATAATAQPTAHRSNVRQWWDFLFGSS